jgi:hypothetical protein
VRRFSSRQALSGVDAQRPSHRISRPHRRIFTLLFSHRR